MTDSRVVTTVDAVSRVASGAPAGARVPVEVRRSVADPFDAYRRARDGSGGAFLETTGGRDGWGYFGVDPMWRLTVGPDAVALEATATADGGEEGADGVEEGATAGTDGVAADGTDERTHFAGGARSPTLSALEGLVASETLLGDECDVPYPCGAIGWLSYDVARELEDLPASTDDDRGLPRLEAAVFDRLAAWEATGDDGADSSEDEGLGDATTLRIVACPRLRKDPDERSAADVEDAYERGRDRALDLAEATVEGDPEIDPPAVGAPASFESDCGREAYADRVRRVEAFVRDGDTFQANVSQRLVAPAAVHPVIAYDALRRVNPAPYSGLLEFRAADLVSASPELLLERDGDRVRTEPIAGTRPRGDTPEADAALAADLLDDEKERAEHAMLVDLERNDLGKVCAFGSVSVPEYRRIDRYASVMHLVSSVTGRLRADATLSDAIAAVFPGGTITGAPKPRTMEIVDEIEATRRGPYTGSVGIFGFDGRATLNIVIRTLVRHVDEYHLRVGAGIVCDSDPYREYEETLDKARALLVAMDDALDERAELALETGADAGHGVDDGRIAQVDTEHDCGGDERD